LHLRQPWFHVSLLVPPCLLFPAPVPNPLSPAPVTSWLLLPPLVDQWLSMYSMAWTPFSSSFFYLPSTIMAEKSWAHFLQKLKENDSSLADIAESTEEVLLGILDDFSFSNLQKGQILTRFKTEGQSPPEPPASCLLPPAPSPAPVSAPEPLSPLPSKPYLLSILGVALLAYERLSWRLKIIN